MNEKQWFTTLVIFLFTLFFSWMSWMNIRVKSEKYREGITTTRVKIEGVTHSFTSALISVVIFAAASHYYPTWELLLSGSVSVAGGALLGETIIKFAERKINND
jgi:hypothetical protein